MGIFGLKRSARNSYIRSGACCLSTSLFPLSGVILRKVSLKSCGVTRVRLRGRSFAVVLLADQALRGGLPRSSQSNMPCQKRFCPFLLPFAAAALGRLLPKSCTTGFIKWNTTKPKEQCDHPRSVCLPLFALGFSCCLCSGSASSPSLGANPWGDQSYDLDIRRLTYIKSMSDI